MDYIRTYKRGDIQFKSSKKIYIITNIIVLIFAAVLLLIGYITEPKRVLFVIGATVTVILYVDYTERWSIRTENDTLFIKLGWINYTIPFEDLINIRTRINRGRNSHHSCDKILQIKYRKNNKIKYKELTYKKSNYLNIDRSKNNNPISSEEELTDKELFYRKFMDEYEIMEFIRKFSKNKLQEENDVYLNIRTPEEEKELEELLNKELWNKDIAYIEPKKLYIVIISTVVITLGIILYFLIPYIIKCNNV